MLRLRAVHISLVEFVLDCNLKTRFEMYCNQNTIRPNHFFDESVLIQKIHKRIPCMSITHIVFFGGRLVRRMVNNAGNGSLAALVTQCAPLVTQCAPLAQQCASVVLQTVFVRNTHNVTVGIMELSLSVLFAGLPFTFVNVSRLVR